MNKSNEIEYQSIVKQKIRRKMLFGCLYTVLILLCLFSYSFYYIFFKRTLIAEYSSPNGEYALLIYEKDWTLTWLDVYKTYYVVTETGDEWVMHPLVNIGDERLPSVVWYSEDEACVNFPADGGDKALLYLAPDTFEYGCVR